MKLIEKDALLAEIENRIKELQNLYKENEEKLDSIQKTAILLCIKECKVILSVIDTLEVKEVDLDTNFGVCWGEYCDCGGNINDYKVAKHFFELGLKVSQKGEKV